MSKAARPRGRPQDAHLTEAVLDAALEILAAGGFKALTLEGVARRAGVSRTAIYKRWPGLPDLILDVAKRALAGRGTTVDDMRAPDTGALATDLAEYVEQGMGRLQALEELGVALPLLAESILSPSLGARARDELFRGDLQVFEAIMGRAVSRGELPVPPARPAALFHALVGYGLFRTYILHETLERDDLLALCEAIVRGMSARPASL